ncbi:DNA-binding response regulator (plasmid) [Fulvitalea axinellae]|uniref:DNA-binding response regulator n=1 Tax=Fulvitalea axinellae TaxID=1182444 RepID=A0AAU9CYI1_9BACT|nr:DNA-binding response regulator [Fulvitalea axinellae]
MMSEKVKIVIADDHKMFLDGLVSMLEKDFEIEHTAKNGQNALSYLRANPEINVDVLISDITMPELDGMALNKVVKKEFPETRTLMVSMHRDPDMIKGLIEDGVDGFVPKNAEKAELLRAVKSIMGGEKYFSREVQEAYMKSVFDARNSPEVSLTKREEEVLALIAQEYTTQEIADKLFLSKHTIESYRKNLIAKLEVRNLAGLTKVAIKRGLVKM